MSDKHYGTCSWSPEGEFESHTPFGAINLFNEGGQRAVELMLLSAAACLNFFLVEYVKARNLSVRHTKVICNGEVVQSPERVARIDTHVTIDGDLNDNEIKKMVTMCERACKVMNTFKQQPEVHVHVGRVPAPASSARGRSKARSTPRKPAARTRARRETAR